MAFQRFVDLSQDHTDTQFNSLFSNTGLQGSSNLNSLSAESSEMVRFVRYKLGEPILTVELDNAQIDVLFEEANLEYSRILSTLQIANNFAEIFGLSQDYNAHDLKQKLPTETWSYLRRYSKNFGIFGPTPVGGNIASRRGYFECEVGKQDYNINTELTDEESGIAVGQYILNSPMSANNSGAIITKIHHYAPISLFRFFDPWNSLNMMNQEFNIESYTMGGQYYMLPVWNDILRGQVFKQSDQVRRSNFSYNQFGNKLQIMPCPKRAIKIYFEWFCEPDSMVNPDGLPSAEAGLTGSLSAVPPQINAMWNVPITDISYKEMNPVARQWIRQYTVALAKEALGLIREKYSTIPIPNGDVTLNGSSLISQSQTEMQRLREELKTDLEQFKKENLMKQEEDMMTSAYNQMKFFPLGGPIIG